MYNYDHKHHSISMTEYHTIEITEYDADYNRLSLIGTMSEQSAKGFIRDYSEITVDKIIFDDGPEYVTFCVDGRDNMDWFYDVLVNLIYPVD